MVATHVELTAPHTGWLMVNTIATIPRTTQTTPLVLADGDGPQYLCRPFVSLTSRLNSQEKMSRLFKPFSRERATAPVQLMATTALRRGRP